MVMGELARETDVAVIGAGPGGYVAAFRAADLGLETILVDIRERPGGVCLYVGCIPSKALLHVSQLLSEVREAASIGIDFGQPQIDLDAVRSWKDNVVSRFTGGLSQLSDLRGVEFVRGRARFEDSATLRLEDAEVSQIKFRHAILATGSRPAPVPGTEIESVRVLDSSSALDLEEVPESLLVVGGGYIGLELGTVYAALGSEVTVVELTGTLLPGVDRDLVRPLAKKLGAEFSNVWVNTRVVAMKEVEKGVEVELEGEAEQEKIVVDKVLVAVGRRPNTEDLGLENTGVKVNSRGFVEIDQQCRTGDERIFAIGDVAGQPMLAHKAMREGKIAAEVIAGHPAAFDNQVVPAVVFTDPEVAWCGLTETEAREQGLSYEVSRFPWAASSRAATLGRTEGLTKILFEPDSGRVLGVGIVGRQAGELIAEGALAVEMAAVAEDLAATIHSHPTLSETVGEAAEAFLGQAVHIYRKKSSQEH